MKVPRPLLVVVIVIIVLGVVACGAGVIRGRLDAAGPQPTPAKQFNGLGGSAIPRRDVRFTGDCANNPNDLTVAVNGTCRTTIEPRFLRSQKLKLTPSGGDVTVTVSQEIRGNIETQSDTVDAGDEVEVAVAGTSPVAVFFSCTCTLVFAS